MLSNLGWGYIDRPAPTLSNSITRGIAGGSGAAKRIRESYEKGTFIASPHGDGTSTNQAEITRILEHEALTLQGYPANFRLKGTKTSKMLQLGNAVPPPVARGVLENMGSDLVLLDLFAGSGVGVAAKQLGIKEYGVEIMKDAISTREANGMETIFYNVWDGLEDPDIVPEYNALWASPPCQTFSLAGSGSGRKALTQVLSLIESGAYLDVAELREAGTKLGDERTALVLSPLAYAVRDMPTYIAFEQVPPVLPVWEACAKVLRDLGYSTWVGFLHAEQYGVPQTRKRAYLIARRDGLTAGPPEPTHSKYYSNDPTRLDLGVPKWVSMFEALGKVGYSRLQTLKNSAIRSTDEPVNTLAFGHDFNSAKIYDTLDGAKALSGGVNLTIDEAKQLQSYPSDFILEGSKYSKSLQVGNAVPPKVAEAVLLGFDNPSALL